VQGYTIGPASTDSRASTQVGRTTISAAEASGQTVISITSNTDTTTYPGTTLTMADTNFVAIQQDDGTLHFTTISGTPGATMTIAVALTAAAAAGNYVYFFASRAQRLVFVESAVIRDENNTDTPIHVYRTVEEYDAGVSDKYADGDPTAILIEPLRINTRVTLNSQPTDVTKRLILTGLYPQEDYDSASDDVSFPQEALRFLAWELSFEIADAYGKDWTASMERKRQEAKETYFNMYPEVCNLYFNPGGL
jgi:hypothetical protein